MRYAILGSLSATSIVRASTRRRSADLHVGNPNGETGIISGIRGNRSIPTTLYAWNEAPAISARPFGGISAVLGGKTPPIFAYDGLGRYRILP